MLLSHIYIIHYILIKVIINILYTIMILMFTCNMYNTVVTGQQLMNIG